jgi:hypothetical protein
MNDIAKHDPLEMGPAVEITSDEAAATPLAVRAQAEIQSSIIIAKKFPRDVTKGYMELQKSARRPTFARKARYSFPRGGQEVAGPSVNLAREAARCWGNIRYGVTMMPTEDDEEWIQIEAWAHDAETNTWAYAQDRFPNKVQRRNKGWVKPDERDRRELVNRRGAISVRNALLQLLPFDVIEDAVNACLATTRAAASQDLEENREDTIRKLVMAFEQMGVTKEMIEKRLGHSTELTDAAELDELRSVWHSMHDGNTNRNDHFNVPAAQAEGVADLNDWVDTQVVGGDNA